MSDEICRMPATELVARIRATELSPVEVTDAVLARLDRLDPVLHAFCEPTHESARATAARVTARIARGEPVGPLAGVPVAVKDLIAVRGVRHAMGSPIYRDFVPDEDDVAVERVKAADAVILGKTTVPEFGYSGVGHNPVSPAARNPWDIAMTPGGSSAGSGAAVAAGIGPVALGTDGGGSVRIPAAHCGVYGFKPSMGRVPMYPGARDERYPGASGWESIGHIGPLTRTVADAALLMSVLAGPDPRDRLSLPAGDVDWTTAAEGGISGARVAFSPDWGYLAVDPAVRQLTARAAAVFEQELGCSVDEAHPGWADPFDAFWTLAVGDTDLTGMRAKIAEYGAEMSPPVVELLTKDWTAQQLTDAKTARKAVCNTMWRFMADYDLLITPTLAVPPFPLNNQGPEIIDGRMVPSLAWLGFCFPINMTGQPAATSPTPTSCVPRPPSKRPPPGRSTGRGCSDGLVDSDLCSVAVCGHRKA
jgi:aspartyl-tRNA(Asn)/glutamyl-tRNA(Gln) amidotransferase subunit A